MVLIRPSEMHAAGKYGTITISSCDMSEGGNLAGKDAIIIQRAIIKRIQSGKETHSRWHTHGRRTVCRIKAYPLSCKTIHIRRIDGCISITASDRRIMLVCANQYDIGLLR